MSNCSESKVKLHRVIVSGSKHGTLYVTDDESLTFLIKVKQLEERVVGEKIVKSWRYGAITGSIDPMLAMDFHDGMYLPGKIHVIESFSPVIQEEPEEFIKKEKNGSICRVNGKVVYRKEQYIQDYLKEDILIDK
jgi:hypothetical protein